MKRRRNDEVDSRQPELIEESSSIKLLISEKKQGRPSGCSDWNDSQIKIFLEEIFKRWIELNIRREIMRGDRKNNSLLQRVFKKLI